MTTRFTVDGPTITFDDGGMNLLSSDALRELRDIITGFDADALLFRSGRPNVFAAGADMAEMANFSALEAMEFSRLGQDLFKTIEKLPIPTVAFIDGDCFGGALDLVFAFDLRFATERSRFSHPGAKLGIVTGFGGTSRWRRLIAPAAARRLFLGNEVLTAQQALDIGIVDALGEPRIPSVDRDTFRFVKELARHGDRLGERDLDALAVRLGHIYFGR
jgi:enoyl-CoA hydratase